VLKGRIGDTECSGVGGIVHCYPERAILAFTDPDVVLYAYDINIDIMQDDRDMEQLPSLLGRDILSRWKITYDLLGVGIRVNKVYSADKEFDLRPPARL